MNMQVQTQQAQPDTFESIAAEVRSQMGLGPDGAPIDQVTPDQPQYPETGEDQLETADLQQDGGDPENNAEVPEGEAPETMTLASLAEEIQVSPEFLYNNIEIGMGIEGADPIKLGELKDKYEATVLENQKLRTEAQNQQPAYAQAPSDHDMQVMQMMYQRDLQRLSEAEQSVPWEELRVKNPGEFAAQQTQLQNARMNLDREYGAMFQNMQRTREQAQEHQLMQANAYLQEKMPGWADPKTRVADMNLIRNTAKEFGYTDLEIKGASDPRYMLVMLELSRLRAEKGMAQKTMSRVKPQPLMRAGSRTGARVDNVDKLEERAKRTGSKEDIRAAMRAIYSQGRTQR